ncbi:class I SAM-dependent DNA methyltransferase [Kamptonema formosum]|uniref:class I SAM-dependent DNA methyltransferase n=1 Tax=Kamptonema formosum TaxID=331992 RepID=UPI00034AB3C9|nr:class I SAM-dependent methyltransferase [Oscillatoria sp. PCC 10802]
MSVFGNYARYYDLLYRDKDYAGEAHYVSKLLQAHAPAAQSILELGCGTGAHAALLAEKGYEVCGVDMSAEMLERANKRLQALPAQQASKLQFHQGDIRTFRLIRQFDAVISLFHVISYQTANEDLRAAFATAKTHLKPGGAFIFDCWYGPAVLSDPPAVRVKRLQDEEIAVTRIAEPVMYANDNLVDVNYQVFIKNLQDGTIDTIEETHRMRYLFKPELELLLSGAGFELMACGEWMTDKEPGFNTWGVYFVGRAS